MTSTPSADRWRRLIAGWRDSDTSVASFCAAHSVQPSSFYYWRRRLEEVSTASAAASSALALSFVEVTAERAPPTHASTYEVLLPNGRRVLVPAAFDEHVLHRLLAIVEGGA